MSSTFVRIGASLALFLAGSSWHFSACSQSAPDNGPTSVTGPVPALPQDPWTYDQVTAQIPRAEAPIASVALAKINLSLHEARRNVEQRLCTGRWTLQGTVLHEQGPALDQARGAQDPATASWHYTSFRIPHNLSCNTTISRARFFLEMSRYLPEWIQIRPAGLNIAFQQGRAVLVQETFARTEPHHSY